MRGRTLLFLSVSAGVALAWIVACGSQGGSMGSPFVPDPEDGDSPTRGSDANGNGNGNADDGSTPDASTCKPLTCADQGIECGPAGDGCGGILPDCGQCAFGLHCGGPNAPSKCVSPNIGGCLSKSCAEQGIECGPSFDGCGFLIPSCGTCDAGTQCGSGTTHSKCLTPQPEVPCTPKTCAEADASCGQAPNGCGGLTPSCGTCDDNFACKAGGCIRVCMPRTCTEAGAKCGYAADGCGGLIDCGACPGQ